MKTEYALMIHEAVQRGLDPAELARLLETCDIQRVCGLARELISEQSDYTYTEVCERDGIVRKMKLSVISEKIDRIEKQIEEL